MLDTIDRPRTFTSRNGAKAPLPFTDAEYHRRLARLRAIMAERDLAVVVLTSMHNIAYYSGFLYCSFGRPFGCVVTQEACTTVSANIDGGQPWRRSISDNVIYTDWRRDNFWHAIATLINGERRLGIEADHLTLAARENLLVACSTADLVDVATDIMAARMIKSVEEIALIREGARIADIGGGPCAMRSKSVPARSMSRWPAAMPWSTRSPLPSRTVNCATPGCGSSPASIPTAPTTR